MRPLVEVHLRGLWLHDVASDDQIRTLMSGGDPFPKWRKILEVLKPRYSDELFEHAEQNYGMMCGFTHGGAEQFMFVPNADGTILSNYPEELVVANMCLSTWTLATHGIIICSMLDSQDAAAEIRARCIERFSQLPGE
jgi:hypothetical protein